MCHQIVSLKYFLNGSLTYTDLIQFKIIIYEHRSINLDTNTHYL